MQRRSEPSLSLVVDNAESAPLEQLIERYTAQINAHHDQLLGDLEYVRTQLHALETIDPLDNTGLGKIYRRHAKRIDSLLSRQKSNSRAS